MKKKKKQNIVETRDKLFPGGIKLSDLFNGRLITRKPIYDFLIHNQAKLFGHLLDFGCGSMQYRQVFNNADKYIGLDVEEAEKNGFKPDNDVVLYDGRNIPFSKEYFDSCVAIEVLEHVEDLDYSLHEINRVIKLGGFFIFSVPMAFPIHLEPWDYRRFTPNGIKKMMEDNGFEIQTIEASTTAKNTIRRLKIIELSRNNDIAIRRVYRKVYTVYANICYLMEKDRGDKKRKTSKLPIDYLVLSKKVKRGYE